uniref:Prephenate/arogenate dehydrogenase domain-containing protein n=1 Tax=Polytomella parva TaxID=51329 RepID=A0A7S0UJ84_9CHLO|nr:arogenate/prephenate dehydrogenase (fisN) [Polytomella parva]|mmetsp:Transcript_11172/g.20215  ORF Transcript_11172/g.20215 Transcript_11172/m.20215 type:complete len:380 (+) Transcript_11172:66-1205(+)
MISLNSAFISNKPTSSCRPGKRITFVQPICSLNKRNSGIALSSTSSTDRNAETKSKRTVKVKAENTSAPVEPLQVNATTETIDSDQEDDLKFTVGIIGFGKFGQFLAKRLVASGHKVLATSRTSYDKVAKDLGVGFYSDIDDFCEEHPEIIILASSIPSTEKVLTSIPFQRLKRNTLFVDVLSVKVFPKYLLKRVLPPNMDILCTHPMFGPDSGRGSWNGLNFMYERVQIGPGAYRQRRIETFLRFFRDQGCRMVEMSCEEHDRQAASTQFITHTVGRILGAMDLKSTDIDTKGFEALLNLVNNTANDSFELYYGLFLYNRSAADEISRLEAAFKSIKKQLFGRLDNIAREMLLGSAVIEAEKNSSSSNNSSDSGIGKQ